MVKAMNIILLSGGSGKRLWPLSNGVRSKQFIKIFRAEDGCYESMLQRVYRQIKSVDVKADITVATSKAQASAVRNQLGEDVGLCVEPCRKDTFPAVALASAYLADVKGVPLDEGVIICPVDPWVDQSYFVSLKQLGEEAEKGSANILLMGIEPTYPSEKYGYIIPEGDGALSRVHMFKEKPDAALAGEYIRQGALWNCGVFAYKLKYMLDKAEKLTGHRSYAGMLGDYGALPCISLDYAVVEKELDIRVLRFRGMWKDLGTWNTLTEEMDKEVAGNGDLDSTSVNSTIINELDIPVLGIGLKGMVVAASPDGILVSAKQESSCMKQYVDRLDSLVRFAEKSWGTYKVIDAGKESLTIKITLKAGYGMNYHSHEYRDEVWAVVSGKGKAIVDGMETSVSAGAVIQLPRGTRHMLAADTDLQAIEVQTGEEICIQDKMKFEQ